MRNNIIDPATVVFSIFSVLCDSHCHISDVTLHVLHLRAANAEELEAKHRLMRYLGSKVVPCRECHGMALAVESHHLLWNPR